MDIRLKRQPIPQAAVLKAIRLHRHERLPWREIGRQLGHAAEALRMRAIGEERRQALDKAMRERRRLEPPEIPAERIVTRLIGENRISLPRLGFLERTDAGFAGMVTATKGEEGRRSDREGRRPTP